MKHVIKTRKKLKKKVAKKLNIPINKLKWMFGGLRILPSLMVLPKTPLIFKEKRTNN